MTIKRANFHLLLALLSASLFSLMAFLPRDWATRSTSTFRIESIYVFNPYIYNTIFYVSALLALFIVFYLIKNKVPLYYRVALIILSVLIYPASCTKSVVSSLGQWTYHEKVTTPDGSTYRFLDSSFLQGQLMAIVKRSNNSLFIHKFDVLVMNNGDSPRSYTRVIRHEGAQDIYGQLYLTPTGYLIGIRYDNMSFLAYNLLTGKAYGHGDIEHLSPFILLEADSQLNTEDINRILESGIGNKPGQPRLEAVNAGLKHANKSVRELADKLLGKVKTETKDATQTKAKSIM